MNHLSSGLRSNLLERGASLVGFADLKDFPAKDRMDFAYGVSIAVAIRPDIIRGIENGPTLAYYDRGHKGRAWLDRQMCVVGHKKLWLCPAIHVCSDQCASACRNTGKCFLLRDLYPLPGSLPRKGCQGHQLVSGTGTGGIL